MTVGTLNMAKIINTTCNQSNQASGVMIVITVEKISLLQHYYKSRIFFECFPLTRCADMQITVETYKIFLDQVICIFSQEDDEGFQDTLPPKMNVLSLGQQT